MKICLNIYFLFNSSSPCHIRISLPFYDFLQVIIVLIDPGLQRGDLAPLNGLLL